MADVSCQFQRQVNTTVMGAKQLGGGMEGALLGKVSGARWGGGQPCQLSLCSSVRKGGREEVTSEQVQSEVTEASESRLICASCKLLLL